ncbi:hypothetical protein ANN_24818 [Periplaneta americana]|uniref:Uncharacterized protein n=1 Tax=Periplaneta americana TaxID=6978 RepID=A0ABQ8RZT1_PERAM|nr:hypothetical protein ANN_24818 [Periplaneta americana]
MFGAKRDEVTGEWRKLHNTELHALYSSPDMIRNIKSRRLKWAGLLGLPDFKNYIFVVDRLLWDLQQVRENEDMSLDRTTQKTTAKPKISKNSLQETMKTSSNKKQCSSSDSSATTKKSCNIKQCKKSFNYYNPPASTSSHRTDSEGKIFCPDCDEAYGEPISEDWISVVGANSGAMKIVQDTKALDFLNETCVDTHS